jgi:hypothetical protein
MRPPGSVSRRLVLTAAAALGLHQVRASAGWGVHAHGELDTAHAYVPVATWSVLVVGALLTAHFVLRLATPRRSAPGGPDPRAGLLRRWASTSATLALLCVAQELVEHLWVTGDLPPLNMVFGGGGWTVIPLAALLGAGVTALAWGSDVALTIPVRAAITAVQRVLWPGLVCSVSSAHPRRREPLAGLAAERAPPSSPIFL